MKSSKPNIAARDRLIVALDLPTERDALQVVETLAGSVFHYKIGLQLYTAAGPAVVRAVAATGAKVFLDLKLHDIPNTVAKAVGVAGELGIEMLTVHLSGGRAMLEAAVSARRGDLLLLGVTVLTSMDAESLRETGINDSIEDHVVKLARLGRECRVGGLVASPHEITALRTNLGEAVTLVTPGVRPDWAEAGDQKRFTWPRQAIASGADYLVIGRPITAHPNPQEAVAMIVGEMEQAARP